MRARLRPPALTGSLHMFASALAHGIVCLGCLTAVAAAAVPADDEPLEAPVPEIARRHRLMYRFAPGQVVHYEAVHTSKLTTQKGQFAETARNESKTRKHFRVIALAEDGSALLELTLDRVEMAARFGEAPAVSLDTAKPDHVPPLYRGVIKTIGRPLARVRVSASGKLLDSKSLLPPEVEAEVSGLPTGRESADDDPAKNFLVPFPAEPVAVGDEWTDSFTVSVFVTRTLTRDVKVLRKYKLESVAGGRARIAVGTAVVTPLREPAISAQLIQREPSGTIEFDLERGLIVSRQSTIDKTVLAPFGDDTFMHAESRLTETLVDGERVVQTRGR
ncbi:MAG TPA: hypothetical protein VML55_01610 [Planctomycetaceae bacterium]|nr:hypothetical protein [Planctomycetaceae bacterium]